MWYLSRHAPSSIQCAMCDQQRAMSSVLASCRGGVIVYSIELSNETLSVADGPCILDLGGPPHDFAQASNSRSGQSRWSSLQDHGAPISTYRIYICICTC
jgi:hypothetical protein